MPWISKKRLASLESQLSQVAEDTKTIRHLLDSHSQAIQSMTANIRGIEHAIKEETPAALWAIYNMLRDKDQIHPPKPLLQTEDIPGVVLLPLDVHQQYELLFFNPLQQNLYASRITLNSAYAKVYTLKKRYSLHIDTLKAPYGFADALLLLNEKSGPIYLGLRKADGKTASGKTRYQVEYWPSKGKPHDRDLPGEYAYHVIFFFEKELEADDFIITYEAGPPESLYDEDADDEDDKAD